MPVLPVCLFEPVWQQFEVLLPDHPVVAPSHPLGCHRPRIPDRMVFEQVVSALVHGSGYDSGVTRNLLAGLAITGEIAHRGVPAPLQVGKRWVVERTQSWMNGYGKLRRCTERTGQVVDFYLFLAATFVVTRCLIRQARTRYRWPTRPTTRRLT